MTDIRHVRTPDHDDRLERYLLGLLDEPARESVEAEAFSDAATAVALDEVETTLVDGYVHGTLDATRRDAFARVLATHSRLQARVRVAHALARRPAPLRQRWTWLPLLAAAAVLIVAGTWVLMQRMPAAPSTFTAQDQPAAPPPPTATLPRPAAPAETPPMPPPGPVARLPERSVFAVTLARGVTRAADVTLVRVPVSATHVQLRVPVAEGDDFARYRLRVTDAAGRAAGVGEFASLDADRTVWVLVERGTFTDGLYDVRVEGINADGLVEPLSLQQVRITLDRAP